MAAALTSSCSDRSANPPDPSSPSDYYRAMDKVWQDVETGGAVYVGNMHSALDLNLLKHHNITSVVNCTDHLENAFENLPTFSYLRFDRIDPYSESFPDDLESDSEGEASDSEYDEDDLDEAQAEAARVFFEPMCLFVDAAIAAGRSVLFHCVAGAHRSGTAGTYWYVR